jgi:hypothetical protein
VKMLQAWNDLSCPVAICEVWKSEIVLKLFIVTTCKCSINPVIQNPFYSHSYTSLYIYIYIYILISWDGVGWDWVHLVRRTLFGLLYQPRMMHTCGTVGGMIIGMGNQSARTKPAPVPYFSPQIPYDLMWDRTQITRAMARLWMLQ